MNNKSIKYILFSLIIFSFIGYIIMPQTIPTHTNILGKINTLSNKNMYILITAIRIFLIIFLSFLFNKLNEKKEKKTNIIIITILLVFVYIDHLFNLYCLTKFKNTQNNIFAINMSFNEKFIMIISTIFFLFGIFSPIFPRNFIIGMRNHYALKSSNTWDYIHKEKNIYSLYLSELNFLILILPNIDDTIKLVLSCCSIIVLFLYLHFLSKKYYYDNLSNA